MRNLVFIVLALCAVPAFAQRVEPPPQDQSKWYLTIFTHSDWASRPQEKLLIDSFRSGPMAELKEKAHFKHYTELDPVYRSGRFEDIPESSFPVITLGRADGGYVFKASKDTMPVPGQALFDAMKDAYQRDKEIPDLNQPISQDSLSPDTSINRDPWLPNAPWNAGRQVDQAMEGIFGGDTPVRDSLGYAAFGVGLVVMLFFLSIAFAGTIALVFLVLLAVRFFRN